MGTELGVEEAREALESFESQIQQIPDPAPPPPWTSAKIQARETAEDAWQRYLAYFLDPHKPHGLGRDALRLFLQGLREHGEDDIPTRISNDCKIEQEIQSEEESNIPDIAVIEPGRFFICMELKVTARENHRQTQRYVADSQIGSVSKQTFTDGGHYVYIKKPGEPAAEADEFVTITWTQIRSWLSPLLIDNRGRYPSRTVAQLDDFLSTIQQNMTEQEHITNAREHMELYLEYQDVIQQAKQGLNTVFEHERDTWASRFRGDYLPETWTDSWNCNENRYGQIYHDDWYRGDDLELNENIRLHFVHLIRDKESFVEGRLTMQLRMPGGSAYREKFKELFASSTYEDRLDPVLDDLGIQKRPYDYDYTNPRFTEKVYSVPRSDLPDSYYETLTDAVAEHQELGPIISDILEDAIDEVER